jgi:sulfatase maturation enzyme AslB (radical SAM superfamily)
MNTCIDAYKNLNIVNQTNQLAVSNCCLITEQKVSTIDFYNNNFLKSIRSQWNQGVFPAACHICKDVEDSGGVSRRLASNQWYQDHGLFNTTVELLRLDYWTGDTCNLACVICGPHNSSSWKQELKLLTDLKKSSTNTHWQSLDLSQLKFIHFNGGEPLLSKEHVDFLKTIPNKNLVQINYNTNGTILPSSFLIDLWSQFKLVKLDFSIDDIGQRFEYQRYPARWSAVADNLHWFRENSPHNCMIAVNTSVGILNHDNLDNLNSWLITNFSATKYTDPIERRQQPVAGIFSLIDADKRKDKIIDFLNKCDQRRGTSWKTTFPNLINYLETDK